MVIPIAILHSAAHRGARYELPGPLLAQPPGEAADAGSRPSAAGPLAIMSAPDSCGPLATGTALASTAAGTAGVRTVSRSATRTAHPSKNSASARARNENRDPAAGIPPIPPEAPLAATATAGTARYT